MRLIDADALIEYCKRIVSVAWNNKVAPISWSQAYQEFISELEEAPTIEAEPVRHGKWHRTFVDGFNRWHFVYDCSECGIRTETTTKYCPNCGAKMK